jgi:hypothetical protein
VWWGSAILPSMKNRDQADGGVGSSLECAPAHPAPELPAWKAFVVQFSRETGTNPGILSGRIEHLSSGRRARFNTSEELLTSLRTLLDELCRASLDRD